MDYPFFTRKLAEAPADLMADLRVHVSGQPVRDHPSFVRAYAVKQQTEAVPPALLGRVLDVVEPWIPAESYVDHSVNVLPASTTVNEHRDGWKPEFRARVQHTHCLHLPIFTNENCLMFHRRDPHVGRDRSHLAAGSIYAYNNYVLHSIVNGSNLVRVHLILYYSDPKWVHKAAMLAKMGLQGHQLYEE